MVLNFKNDINDFEEWYYASKKLEKKNKKGFNKKYIY